MSDHEHGRAVELLDACERGDEAKIGRLGWRPVLDALRTWSTKAGWDGDTLAPYASILGDEDTAEVVQAIRSFQGNRWPPNANEVWTALYPDHTPRAPKQIAAERPSAGVTRRPDNSDAAYRAVLDEVVMGAEVCECVPRSPQWTIDRHGVLWCPECGYLEPGQYDQALEWQNPGRPEPPAPTAEDVRRWARDEQLLRLRQGKQPSPLLRKLMGGDDEAIRKLAATFGLSFSVALDEDKP
jgi:hypothetical protein